MWKESPLFNEGTGVALAPALSLGTVMWRGSGREQHPPEPVGYLHAVCVVQEWGLLHPEVVGNQGVEAI